MNQDQKICELQNILRRVQRLGLTFTRGNAYISASYIEEQDELNKKINELIGETR